MEFQINDADFQHSTFYTYLDTLTSSVCKNLKSVIARETLANHLNQLFCVPDLFSDYQECFFDQQGYCEKFASEISFGNTELDFLYVYLELDLKPHWVFRVEREHLGGEVLDVRIDFTMSSMHTCEIFSFTDANGDEAALDIHSPFWTKAADEFTASLRS